MDFKTLKALDKGTNVAKTPTPDRNWRNNPTGQSRMQYQSDQCHLKRVLSVLTADYRFLDVTLSRFNSLNTNHAMILLTNKERLIDIISEIHVYYLKKSKRRHFS